MYHSASIFKTGRQMKYPPWEPFCKIMCTRCNLVLPVKKKNQQKHFLNTCLWATGMSWLWQQGLGMQRRQRNHLPLSSAHECRTLTPSQSVLGTAAQPRKSRVIQSSSSEMRAQRKILIATRLRTLSTLLRPWRANGKIYGELSKPSECFFQRKLKCSCWHSRFQSCTTAVQLDATRLPVLLLKSCSSAKSLRYKQWPQALPSPSQACSHVSNRHL